MLVDFSFDFENIVKLCAVLFYALKFVIVIFRDSSLTLRMTN